MRKPWIGATVYSGSAIVQIKDRSAAKKAALVMRVMPRFCRCKPPPHLGRAITPFVPHDDLEPEIDHGFGEGSLYAAHLDRGWHLFDAGDTSGARKSGTRAHALFPEDPDAPLLLAAIAQAEGEFEEALRWYDAAIEVDPEYPEPYISAAQTLLYELEEYDRAREKLESAQQLEDLVPLERIEVDLLLAECEHQAHRPEPARQALERTGVIHTMQSLLGKGSPLPVAELLSSAPPKRKRSTQLKALAKLGALEADDIDEQDLFALSRRICFQYYRLCRLLCDLDRVDPARELSAYALALFPEEADLWYLRGDCEYRSGNTQRALEASLQVLALDTQKELPPWAPSESELRDDMRKILASLARSRRLPPGLKLDEIRVVVLERPSFELIYEGLDPRSGLIALSPPSQDPQKVPVTTLVLYRSNLARFAQHSDQMQADLLELLQDELLSHSQRLQDLAAMHAAPAVTSRVKRSTGSSSPASSKTKSKPTPKSGQSSPKKPALSAGKKTPKAPKVKAETSGPADPARRSSKKSSRVRKKNK